VLTDRPTLF